MARPRSVPIVTSAHFQVGGEERRSTSSRENPHVVWATEDGVHDHGVSLRLADHFGREQLLDPAQAREDEEPGIGQVGPHPDPLGGGLDQIGRGLEDAP